MSGIVSQYLREGATLPPNFIPVSTIIDDAVASGADSQYTVPDKVKFIRIVTTPDAAVYFAWGAAAAAADDEFHWYIPANSVLDILVPAVDSDGANSVPSQFSLIAESGTAKVRITMIKETFA